MIQFKMKLLFITFFFCSCLSYFNAKPADDIASTNLTLIQIGTTIIPEIFNTTEAAAETKRKCIVGNNFGKNLILKINMIRKLKRLFNTRPMLRPRPMRPLRPPLRPPRPPMRPLRPPLRPLRPPMRPLRPPLRPPRPPHLHYPVPPPPPMPMPMPPPPPPPMPIPMPPPPVHYHPPQPAWYAQPAQTCTMGCCVCCCVVVATCPPCPSYYPVAPCTQPCGMGK